MGILEGKKPCSWNSCMTRARRWSRVRRKDEQGSRSKSPRRSSPSVSSQTKRTTLYSLSARSFGVVLQLLDLSYLSFRRWRCLRRTWQHSSECWAPSCSWRGDGSSSSENWGLLQMFPALDKQQMKEMEKVSALRETGQVRKNPKT